MIASSFSSAQNNGFGEGLSRFELALQASGGRLYIGERFSEYLNSVAEKIAVASSHNENVEVAVFNDRQMSLWSLPEGKVAISHGLFQEVKNEAEIAALIAHGLSHHTASVIGSSNAQVIQASRPYSIALPLRSVPPNYAIGETNQNLGHVYANYGPVVEMVADLESQDLMAKAGYDPSVLAPLLARLDAKREDDHPFFVAHSPSDARINQARGNAARIRARFTETVFRRNEKQFGSMAEDLSDAAGQSYLNFDRALSEPKVKKALKLANKAIKQFDKEGAFYNLLGELFYETGAYEKASTAFQKALVMNEDNYGYHLNLGRSLFELNQFDDAKEHFEQSLSGLPNAIALNELGKLEEQMGHYDRAKLSYLMLMGEGGTLGRAGERAFVRLDLRDSPHLYFLTQTLVADDGIITTIVTNQSGYAVDGLEVTFRAVINSVSFETVLMVGPLEKVDQVRLYPGWETSESDTIEKVSVRVTRIIE